MHNTDVVLNYRKTSNRSRTLVGNQIVDLSDVVGASPVILDLTPDVNGLGKEKCKTTRNEFKFWDLVPLILAI